MAPGRTMMRQATSSYRPILCFLLALVVARGALYSAIIPPWQVPDEPAQFERTKAALTQADWNSTSANGPGWYDELVKSLLRYRYWDFQWNRPRDKPYPAESRLGDYIALYQEVYTGEVQYGSRPAYLLMGLPLLWAGSQDMAVQLYLVRLYMVLMNVAVVWLAYLTSRVVFPNDTFINLGVPILIALIPQHTQALASVASGNLAELLTTLALYWLVGGIIAGFSWPRLLAVLLVTIAAMWTKATAYFLVFVLGSVGILYVWSYRRWWRWMVPAALVLGGLVYYFAPSRLRLLLEAAWYLLRRGDFYLDPTIPVSIFRSFWASPGLIMIRLHPFWYWTLFIACLLAVGGLIVWLVSRRSVLFSAPFRPRLRALLVMAIAIGAALSVMLGYSVVTKTNIYNQGRSIYPVIVPIALFLMLGWRQLIPVRWRNFGLLGMTSLLFLFDALVMLDYAIPLFYSLRGVS
jgi:hypothetical protein